MNHAEHEFRTRVSAVLRRFIAQNGGTALEADLEAASGRLWALWAERHAKTDGPDRGRGESDDEISALAARALGGLADPLLEEGVRQLTKACFYPELSVCRQSFREVSPDGSCRRQQLARVRRRISGTHCVDCPYWLTFAGTDHAGFLAPHWVAGRDDFTAHHEIFLPEDFRALRHWLHQARTGRQPAH